MEGTAGTGSSSGNKSHTAKQSCENDELCDRCTGARSSGACAGRAKGKCCCTPNGLPSPLCVYYSPRILSLLKGDKTEFETAQTHWTSVDPEVEEETERIAQENREYFDEVLVKHPEWGAFFTRFEDLEIEVGEKIGEGGQAEIFAASSQTYKHRRFLGTLELVAKVWKAGVSLKDLERQWPPEMLLRGVRCDASDWPFSNILGGAFMRDGEFKNRFAFVMLRRGRDLRSAIDLRTLELFCDNSHGPPCTPQHLCQLLKFLAFNLEGMHEAGVIHRDIKASNVLLLRKNSKLEDHVTIVIDFECSVGVIGTGFWRAPEILEQVQRRVPSSELVFTKKSDIYSFGMMCYEMVTGCIPFEGHPQNDYSVVLSGERPELPHDLDGRLKELIVDCWQQDPLLRPTAKSIYERIRHFNNAFFARVGGVSVVELNLLELEFLFRLDFKLSVTISVFESYCTYLERDISAIKKKPERVERSLPAFGSVPGSLYNSVPGTPRGGVPQTPKETSPRFKKRLPPGLPVSYANRKQTSLQYQPPLSQYFVRNSPPSR